VEEEFLERGFGEGGGAPDAAGAGGVGEVVGRKRSAGGDFGEDAFSEGFFSRSEAAGPWAVGARATLHRGEEVGPGFEGKSDEDVGAGQVVLEGEAGVAGFRVLSRGFWVGFSGVRGGVVVEVAHEVAFAVVADAVAENEIVHATADVDGVDLHVAEVGEGGGDVGDGFVEQDGAAREAAGLKRREDERSRSHGRTPTVSGKVQKTSRAARGSAAVMREQQPVVINALTEKRCDQAHAICGRPYGARDGRNHSPGAAPGANSGQASARSVRRFSRARAMRLLTVPTLMPRVAAISS